MFTGLAFFQQESAPIAPSGFPQWDSTVNDIQQWLDAFNLISSTVSSPTLTAAATSITRSGTWTAITYVNNNYMFSPYNTEMVVTYPYGNGQAFHYMELYPGSFSAATFSWVSKSSATSTSIYYAGILANNKNIYATFRDSANITKVEIPASKTGTPTASTIAITGTGWRAGCKTFDGKFVVANDTQIMTFDPATETATYLSHGRGSGTNRWGDAAQAANGKIYFLPYNSPNVLIYDPVAATTSTISITVPSGYGGAVLGGDGNIYGLRKYFVSGSMTNALIKVDTSADTAILTGTYSAPFNMDFLGTVTIGADGKLYGLARGASSGSSVILIRINLSNLSIESTTVGGQYRASDIIWWGGRLNKDGNIWVPFANYRNDNIVRWLKIPTSNQTLNLPDNLILGKPVAKFFAQV